MIMKQEQQIDLRLQSSVPDKNEDPSGITQNLHKVELLFLRTKLILQEICIPSSKSFWLEMTKLYSRQALML